MVDIKQLFRLNMVNNLSIESKLQRRSENMFVVMVTLDFGMTRSTKFSKLNLLAMQKNWCDSRKYPPLQNSYF